jgi:hypothetical protein
MRGKPATTTWRSRGIASGSWSPAALCGLANALNGGQAGGLATLLNNLLGL